MTLSTTENMMNIRCLLMLLIISFSFNTPLSWSDTQLINTQINNAQLVGQSRMKFLIWKIYDIELYASNGIWQAEDSFALSLKYLRNFKGKDIANRSIVEIRKQGFKKEDRLNAWFDEISAIIPDVKKNDRLTAIATASGTTLFCQNETIIGKVEDPEFTKQFFNIWLSQKTSAPKTRKNLLGI